MNTWNYRIVKKQGKYGFHPVFVDENGNITRIVDEPERIFADSMEELKNEFNSIKEAWQKPTINWFTGEEIQELN